MDPIISFLTIKYRTQFISILQIFIGLLLEINMSNRQFTTLQRITIEALDCVIKTNNYDSHGHLNISIEPRIPVNSTNRNADPLLSQTTGQQKELYLQQLFLQPTLHLNCLLLLTQLLARQIQLCLIWKIQ